jgi:hypothetical protein
MTMRPNPKVAAVFENVVAAIEKYDGTVILNVEEVGSAWAQLCELRADLATEGRARVAAFLGALGWNQMEQKPAEILALIKEIDSVYGAGIVLSQ